MDDPPIIKEIINTGFLPQKSANGGNTMEPMLQPTKNKVPTKPNKYLLSQIKENS